MTDGINPTVAIMKIITTPAKILPKSRSARLSGLASSSTMLMKMKNPRITQLDSKGLV